VRPDDIARRAGLTIRNKSPQFTNEDYPYSGHFLKNEGVIEVNTDEGLLRQRFTLAHELGHFALGHEDAPRDMSTSFSAGQVSHIERAANQFAAELLMPADAVAKLVRSGKFKTIEDLAQAFQVSKVAMTYRVNNLGLLV
jgi:Zn-dependent peptidase ImmA (M78 family)